jgi:type II secretory pathway pseudopilin PulG
MNALLRIVPGIGLALILGAASVAIATSPSRSSLAAARTEAASFATREAQLMQRLALLQADDGSVSIPSELIWTGADASSVEIDLQQRVVAAATTAGLQLVSLGASLEVEGSSTPTVAYELEVMGGHEGVARFLADLEVMRPALAISYLWMRQMPPDPSQNVAPVSLRLTVWGFRDGREATP